MSVSGAKQSLGRAVARSSAQDDDRDLEMTSDEQGETGGVEGGAGAGAGAGAGQQHNVTAIEVDEIELLVMQRLATVSRWVN